MPFYLWRRLPEESKSLKWDVECDWWWMVVMVMKSVLHQMMSPCENFLFYWRSIGRLLDWVESLPTHKGSDSSESPNGGGENILIESSTVLNSEKEFSKFDQIDRESHHLLGGPTDRPSWAGRPCHRTFLLAKNPIIDRIGAIHWQMKNLPF